MFRHACVLLSDFLNETANIQEVFCEIRIRHG